METVNISLRVTMGHREAQESPLTELARVLRYLSVRVEEDGPVTWDELESLGGEIIGEVQMTVEGVTG